MAINQIKQRKQENPDDVDKVPIQSGYIDGSEVFGGIPALTPFQDQKGENADAHHHMEGVQTGHREIKREEQFGRPLQLGAFQVKGDLARHMMLFVLRSEE